MDELDEDEEQQWPSTLSDVARAFRRRIRIGFGLCTMAFGVILAELVATLARADLETEQVASLDIAGMVLDGLTIGLLVAGVALLYAVPFGQRWRTASTTFLITCGMDAAFLGLRISQGNSAVSGVLALVSMMLTWVELWMLAVMCAEAAESAERQDITYQTEVIGGFVIWGAFAWALMIAWTFDPKQLTEGTPRSPPDSIALVVSLAAQILQLVVLARLTMCCYGVVMAYAPEGGEQSPQQSVTQK
jgi:hypothetical protein